MAGMDQGRLAVATTDRRGAGHAQGSADWRPANGASQGRLDPDVTRLLAHRFGDGLVYLAEPSERATYQRAVRLGLVSSDGYLTAAGCRAAAESDFS